MAANNLELQVRQLIAATEEPNENGFSTVDVDQLAALTKIAIAQNQSEELCDQLREAEVAHAAQIRTICESSAFNVPSVLAQLDQVTLKADAVRNQTKSVAQRMETSSGRLVEKANTLAHMRKTRQNIEVSSEIVKLCLQALGHVNQVQELLKSNHRVAAVQNLGELQEMDLEELKAIGLGPLLTETVPALTKEISQATLNSLNTFLSLDNLGQCTKVIGEHAIELLIAQKAAWDKLCKQLKHLKSFRFNSPVELAYRRSHSNFLTESELNVDLGPLFEADMVFAKLGRSSELSAYLDSQLSSYNDLLSTTSNLEELLAQLPTIVGFCLFDRSLSNLLPNLRSVKRVDDSWEKLSQCISRTVSSSLGNINDIINLKQELSVAMDTLQNFEFNVSSISDLFRAILQKQCAATIESLRQKRKESMQTGDQLQLVVTSTSSLEYVMKTVWFDKQMTPTTQTLPYAFPFSESYCMVCHTLRVLLDHGNSFMDQFQNDPGFVEELVAKSIDKVLTEIANHLRSVIKGNNRELIVQSLIDGKMFHYAATEIESLLAKMRSTGGRRGSVLLEATGILQKVFKEAETKIYVLLEETVMEFFTSSAFDWNAGHLEDSPSSNVLEMTTYLLTMANTVLKRLPPDVRSLAYFNLAENINTGLRNMLYDVPQEASAVALHNFETDLNFLENGLAQLAPDSSDSMPLLESRQILDLLRAEDPANELSNPQIRMRKYDRLSLSHATQLVRRVTEQITPQQDQLGPKPSIMRRYLG